MKLQFSHWRTLKTRVTLFTLAIFLLSIWLQAYYASRMLHQDMERVLGSQQFSTVSILAAEIDKALQDRSRVLEQLAADLAPMLVDRAALLLYLENRPSLHGHFNGGVMVLDDAGVLLADVPSANGLIDVAEVDAESRNVAVREGRVTISRPFTDRQQRAPAFVMIAPIREADGSVVGLLYGVTSLGKPSFLDRITENRYGRTGDYFVAALRYRLNMTSSDRNRIMESLPPPGVNPLIDRFVAGYEGSARYVNQHRVEILVSVKGVPQANWGVVATLPTDEAFAPVHDMQWRILLGTLFLTLLAGALTWWMLHRQLAPLLDTARAMVALSNANEIPQPLPVKSSDEIGELIGGFNRLLETWAQREKSLRESEAYNKILFAGSHIPLVVLDPETGRLTDCNQAALDLYRLPSRDVLNTLKPVDVSAPFQYDGHSSAEAAEMHIREALRNGSHVFEWLHQRPDGEQWDAEVHLMTFQHGERTLLQFSLQDIGERKRAEANLRVAATAFESQEGMVITDADQKILRINRACSEITGYSPEEVVGKTPRLFSSGKHDAKFYREMWGSIVEKGAWKGEIWNRRKSGEVYPEWFSISAVKGDDGKITHYVASFIDISQRKSAEDEIRHLAFYDPLTHLPNRRLLLDRLRHTLASCSRNESVGALLFIDLDNFKTLNDTLGHDKGDLLLQSVARRLTANVREQDTVARLGGDEFVVMLEGLSQDLRDAAAEAGLVGEKILAAINTHYDLSGLAHHSTASIGVALFTHRDGVEELLRRADLAMYQAKAAGRNTLRFFDPEMQASVNARAALDNELRTAVSEEQFVLYFQPQLTDSGRLIGAETLIRWNHPQRGLLGPAEFISVAEETGLILAIGNWVLLSACSQLATWAEQPSMAPLTLAVNVSARQLRDADFVNRVLAVLEQTGANPERLKLELTESLLVDDVENIILKMNALKAKGVGFSLDDFGTGYSSLSYLKRLPLDQLKIDQSFVRDVLIDPSDAVIAKTIIALADSLGLTVIAEGVETSEQRDFLARQGCLAYQGYLFSRPVPLAGFEAFAART